MINLKQMDEMIKQNNDSSVLFEQTHIEALPETIARRIFHLQMEQNRKLENAKKLI